MKTLIFVLALLLPVSSFAQIVDDVALTPVESVDSERVEIYSYCTNDTNKTYWGIHNTFESQIQVEYQNVKANNPLIAKISHTRPNLVWIPSGETYKLSLPANNSRPNLGVRIAQIPDGRATLPTTVFSATPNTTICQNYFDADASVLESPAVGLALSATAKTKVENENRAVKTAEDQAKIESLKQQIAILIELIRVLTESKSLRVQ